MTLDGLVIAGLAFSATLFVVSVAALVVITLKIQEERSGGCRGAGCRRSRSGNGCTNSPRSVETVRGGSNWRE